MLIVVGVMLAVLLEIADTTIVNVALPTIQGSVGADFDQASWIVTGYLISVVIALPLVPWFESLLGRRRYVVTAILGFTVASVACGLSQSIEALTFFRIVQGLFGGGILTIARAILRDSFPAAEISRSQGLLAIGAVVGPSIGPTLGGILTDSFSWRWCFFINVVPGILAALILATLLRDPPRTRVSSDVAGLVFLVSTLAPLQYVLEQGERNGWFSDTRIVVCMAIAAASAIAFVVWELRVARYPIVDLRILVRPAVRIGAILSFATGFSLFVGIILGPQFSQGILGFTATLSGNLVLVRALGIMLFIPVAVIAMTRLRANPAFLIVIGFLLVGVAAVQAASATTAVSAFWTFGWPMAIGGFGFGLIFVPLSAAVLATVTGSDTSKASAMLSLWQQLGASVATATLVTVIDHSTAIHYASLTSGIELHRAAVSHFLSTGGSRYALASILDQQATTLAFADAFRISAIVALGACVLAFALRPQKPRVETTR